MDREVTLCQNCKHFEWWFKGDMGQRALCRHPYFGKSMINGLKEWVDADAVRRDQNQCGYDAKYYEAKDA